jgi:maltose/moltooligosaccharide transporter
VYVAVLRFGRSRVTSFSRPDEKSPLFAAGTEWGGLSFAVYNVGCFLVAFLIPPIAKATNRKVTHFICLTLGGLGLLSTYFAHDKYFLWIGMAGVGIAVGFDSLDAVCDSRRAR